VAAPSHLSEPSNVTKPAQQASNSTQRIPTLQELPDDVRRDIPQLTIGGAMYSETPASRMLIINSQVFHEGDKPYQGLVLEEIRLKSAVFSYRGYRYLVNY
jgi:general secretion pathway protein B